MNQLKIINEKPPPIAQIKQDLLFFRDYEVVIFGSCIEGGFRPGSDVDIAIITRDFNRNKNLESYRKWMGAVKTPYEIHIFELLPITVKMAIIQKNQVVFGDQLEMSEYFYIYRKIWRDSKHRIEENQFPNSQEMLKTRNLNHLKK